MRDISGSQRNEPLETADAVDLVPLEAELESLVVRYRSARPWPHLIVDGILDPVVADRAARNFPALGAVRTQLANLLQARSYEGDLGAGDPLYAAIYRELHGIRFTAFLRRLTGIDDLEPDLDLAGAGFHQGARGSLLRVHADHNTHPSDETRFRRVNVLIYLNPTWNEAWNGDLELWERDMSVCGTKVAPLLNRCAILSVDDSTYHGYGPLRTPDGTTRKVLAAYYYSGSPASHQITTPHPTLLPPLPTEAFGLRIARRARKRLLDFLVRPRKRFR